MFENLVERVAMKVEEALAAYEESGDVPVPVTPSGKINVSRLVTDWELGTESVRQHMYRDEIVAIINPACERFHIGGIRTANEAADADSRTREFALRKDKQARKSDMATIEAKAEVNGLHSRIVELEKGRRDDAMTIARLEAQLAMVRRGVVPPE